MSLAFSRIVFVCGLGFGLAAIADAAPVRLRVEQRVNPLGIDVMRPSLSWQSDSAERGWKQTAYRVRVATTEAGLKAATPDIWDSGRVESAESVGIAYAGPELKARQRYWWTVEVWDGQKKATSAAAPAWWEMGLLTSADWSAKWIRRDDPEEDKELSEIRWIGLPNAQPGQAAQPLKAEFRYQLHLAKRPFGASLHVFSPGSFVVKVNGVETGHKKEWSSFDREEILDQLKYGEGVAGDNTIEVSVSAPKAKDVSQSYPAALAAVLRLGQNAEATERIATTAKWSVRDDRDASWMPAKDLGALRDLSLGTAADRISRTPPPERVASDSSLFRREFPAKGAVASARLYVTALGSYRVFLNGQRVGEDDLTPGFTDFRKRVLYQTYDVTSLVAKSGTNVLAAMLGPGWHGSPMLWSGVHTFPGPDLLRLQLEMSMADGSRQTVVSDANWKTARSPVLSSEIYGGEAYDARLASAEWDRAGSPRAAWSAAVEGTAPAGLTISAQPDASVHRTSTIRPVNVTMVGSDAVFDMGQNMVGVASLHVRGTAGTVVKLSFAERLNPDGSVYTENLRNADATDVYTLSGKGDEVWEPAFTFHGFRYVQISGYPGKPELGAIEGEVWNSLPDQPAFRLTTSSELLNNMYKLGIWGQRGNFVSIPTDCPQRDERLGWMGDAGVFWRTGSYNFDIDAFSHKFMQDVVDAQTQGGAFTDVSPDLMGNTDTHPAAPGWGDAGVLVPYATWMQYGDRTVLERNWQAMEHWMDFILRTNPNYLRQKALGNNYGDWLAPDQHSPKDLVATAYWALMARQMGEMAKALGKAQDAEKYARLHEQIKEAYDRQYVHGDGEVEGNTQTGYVVTLYAGLVPRGMEANLTDRLVKDIEAHENHLTTGFLGTPFLLFVLDENGRSDVAYRLLLNETYPSWGYMVKKGATTWWERWNGDTGDPGMNSYNHYAFGSVMAWVYRRVTGIDTDSAGAGFHHLVIHPHVESGLTNAHAEYESAYGLVTTEWTRGKDGLQLDVRIPANTTATVYLPNGTITMDGKAVDARREEDQSIVPINAGSYRFIVRAPYSKN
jgi:alpha-L-rhamnosidase